MLEICLATNNAHKVEELQHLLGKSVKLKTLKEIGCFDEIPEDAFTFQENSSQKAQYIWQKYKINCIADDSGLEVDALGGEPGVFSARYAGEHGNHAKNIAKLLEMLQNEDNRAAQFRCVITLLIDGKENYFEGIVRGTITREITGNGGFGYDPIFKPKGFEKTFAEMTMDEKNPISHRGLAVDKLKLFLDSK